MHLLKIKRARPASDSGGNLFRRTEANEVSKIRFIRFLPVGQGDNIINLLTPYLFYVKLQPKHREERVMHGSYRKAICKTA